MPDREKVLFALDCYAEKRVTCIDECPYFIRIAVGFGGHGYGYCAKANIARDAISLIKQEPVEPRWTHPTVDKNVMMCGSCGIEIPLGKPRYCPWCGRAVKKNADGA